jgi:hypothetical protein
MELLGDVGQVEARLGPFGDSVNFGTRKVHSLHRTYHRLKNYIGHTCWYSFVTWVKCKLIWVCLGKVLISAQDRCTVLCRMYHVHGNLFGHTQ